ncbi:hypothetical protein [Spiroplasma tabanidicola]|uniref:Uncharacterized protein n=1 Tax=Spiroplasma tabanidicola TaxID=324079 RepID=A0A6I6CBX8_9MOLU|nr:hypothetical protein [Spiroplasma tabanidicola]QGS51602.1 hypothetical protein STABA_v1c02350 [Spiroplasma tabanidicola]
MIIDKVEILYDKQLLPLKILYSEIRKPTFIEFLVLSIIIEHPKKNLSLKEILNEDFKITNTDFFERALKDLVAYKIVDLNKTKSGWSTLGIDIEVEKLQVDSSIKKQFLQKDYTISQNNKSYDIKYVYDPIRKTYEVINDIDWDKRVKDVKFSYNLKISYQDKDFLNKKFITNNINNFIKNNKDIFGENFIFNDLKINNDLGIEDIDNVKSLVNNVVCANEISIEITKKNNFKIISKENFFENFLKENSNVESEIILNVLQQYNKKILDVFNPKKAIEDTNNFLLEPDLISNINIKTSQNLLLVNNHDVKSFDKLLINKHLLSTAKIIIFYNSRANDKTIETKNGRIIAYVDSSKSKLLDENTLIYIDSESQIEGYAIANKSINEVKINLPVFYKHKNKTKIDLNDIFEDNLERLLDNYRDNLFGNDLKKSTITFLLLKRIGREDKLFEILYEFLKKDIDYGKNFKNLTNVFLEENNKDAILFLEKVLKEVFINVSKKRTAKDIINLIEKYNWLNTSEFLEMINNINLENDMENLFKVNAILDSRKIDGWKGNIRNCLVELFKYSKNRLVPDLLDINKYNSLTWEQHASTINSIGSITKSLYTNDYEKVQSNYSSMLNKLVDIIKSNNNIYDYKNYLLSIGDCIIDFYKEYYNYKINEIQNLDQQDINYKAKILAANFISNLEEKIDSLISEEAESLPVEIKLEWAKFIENKTHEVDKILKDDVTILYSALNLLFAKTEVQSEKSLEHYQNRFRGI